MIKKNQENTPEKALLNFLECWKRKQFKKMIDFLQVTWKLEHEKRGTDIKDLLKNSFFGFKKLIYFEIKTIQTQGIFVDIETIIKYKIQEKTFTKKIKPRIICEIGAYQPSEKGTWGVNPIGVLREY